MARRPQPVQTLSAALAGGARREHEQLFVEIAKAHATRKLSKKMKWSGLDLSIETARGETRSGIDPDGKRWETVMPRDYGYVKNTQSAQDRDHLDVVVNGEHPTEYVWVVHTVNPLSGLYDEDKCFLSFESERDVHECFSEMYGDPEKHFGAISIMPTEQFIAYCQAGRENWNRPLVHNVRSKIALQRRQVEKAQAALEEHRDWLKGRVAVLKAGGPFDDDPEQEAEIEKALGPIQQAIEAMGTSTIEVLSEVSKADGAAEERRLLKITPSFEAIDLQNQLTTKAVIREAWPYYEIQGNVDLEHLTKKGGKTYHEYVQKVAQQGFKVPEGMDEAAGRAYYEIGRPVAGSFDPEECSYVAEIYKGHPVADWFWSTLTEVRPAWPWRPSIQGAAKMAEIVIENPEPIFGKGRQQKIEVLRVFRWNSVGLSLEAINFYTAPVEVLRAGETAISKGVDVSFEQERVVNKAEMVKASDVLKTSLIEKAQDILTDMEDSGQLSASERLSLTQEIAKALSGVEDSEVEVVKALEYGALTTDIAGMTGAQTLTREGLSDRQVRRKAKELLDDLEWTPFQKGYEWSEDPVVDVADYLMGEGVGGDDSLKVAETFFGLLRER